jgi:hypothetical protein
MPGDANGSRFKAIENAGRRSGGAVPGKALRSRRFDHAAPGIHRERAAEGSVTDSDTLVTEEAKIMRERALPSQSSKIQAAIRKALAAVAAGAAFSLAGVGAAHAADADPGLNAGPVKVTFGGYTELALIYRDRNETADVGSNYNTSIPFPNSNNYHLSEFRESARQSRLSMLAQGPKDGNIEAEGYFEMDFLSAAPTANSNESNSYNLRMRNIYGTYLNKDTGLYILAGQSWSLVTLEKKGMRARSEVTPQVIDAQYVAGFNWTRNPQVRFVKELGTASVGLSIESPQALVSNGPNALPTNTVYNNAGGSLFASTNNYSLDYMPDVVAKVAFDPGYGHYELYGLLRGFRDRSNLHSNTTNGGGVGAGMLLPLSKDVDFQVSALAGDGIGRYGSTQLPDVTLRPDGSLATIAEVHALTGLVYRAMPTLTLYGYVGMEKASAKTFTAVSGANTLGYGYGSPLYNNSSCLTDGGSSSACVANTKEIDQVAAGAWWKYYQGTLGNLQFGVQGSYTKRKAFAGVGGEPSTNLTVGMVSFRYYPYQR